MGNVGNLPATNYESSLTQTFSTPTGTSHTLTYSVANSADILVVINNVIQEPDVGYTVSGTTLTTDTLVSGDTMYVYYLALARNTTTPPVNSINATMLAATASNWTGMIGGLTCSNDTDADHDVNITAGYARDYGDAYTMVLSSEITKQIDATWAVGDDAGGLDTGAVAADTGYGIYLIRRSDTGVVDALFSTDMSAAGSSVTMPTNYDQKRLIGWVRTDASSNIIAFFQTGDIFRFKAALPQDVNDSTITNNTEETVTLTVPPLSTAYVVCRYFNTGETSSQMYGYVYPGGNGALGEGASSTEMEFYIDFGATGAPDGIGGQMHVLTNASGQIDYEASEGAGTLSLTINIQGCNMHTRSNPQ